MARNRDRGITAQDLIAMGINSLGPDERWCISHKPEGPIVDTASLDFTYPVRLFCEALGVDWDHASDQGYYLTKMNIVTGAEVT